MQSPPSTMNAMTGGVSAQQKAALQGKSPAKAAPDSDFGSFETAPGAAAGPSTADKMSKLVDLSGGLMANENPAEKAAKDAEMVRMQAQASFGGIDGLPQQQMGGMGMGNIGGMGMGGIGGRPMGGRPMGGQPMQQQQQPGGMMMGQMGQPQMGMGMPQQQMGGMPGMQPQMGTGMGGMPKQQQQFGGMPQQGYPQQQQMGQQMPGGFTQQNPNSFM